MDNLSDLIKCDYSTLTNVLRDILARLGQQNEKIRILETLNQEKDIQIKQLADTVNANNQRVSDIRTNMDLLAQRQDELARDCSQLDTVCVSLREDLNALNRRMDQAGIQGSSSGASNEDVLELTKKLETLDSRVTRLEPLPTLFQQLEANSVTKDNFDQQIQQIEDVLRRIQDNLSRHAMQLRDHDEALRSSNLTTNATAGRQSGSDEDSARSRAEWERSLLSRFVERTQYEAELVGLQDADAHSATEIAKLWSAIRKLKDANEELREAGEVRDAQIQELRNAISSVGRLVNNITDRVNECVSRKDLIALRDELVNQVKEAASALKDHVKRELRRFEKDVIDFVGENVGQQPDNSETAIGKMYFRCLTCNQTTASQHGPHSRSYQASMGIPSLPQGTVKITGTPNSIPHTSTPTILGPAGLAASTTVATPASALSLIAQGGMLIERGEDLTLHGADGQVYKGRESPIVHFAAPHSGAASTSPVPLGSRPGTASGNDNGAGFRVGYIEKDRNSQGPLTSRRTSAKTPRIPTISSSPTPDNQDGSQPLLTTQGNSESSVNLITAGPGLRRPTTASFALTTNSSTGVTPEATSPVPSGTGIGPNGGAAPQPLTTVNGFAATTNLTSDATTTDTANRRPRVLRPATSSGTRSQRD